MKYSRKAILMVFLITSASFFNCKQEKKQADTYSEEESKGIIEIVTNVMDFQTVDTVAAGWNTFKYINKSTEPHFVLFDDYPEGKGEEDAKKVVAPVFEKGMQLIMEGEMEEAMAAFGELPEWFGEIVFVGGSGLISGGEENTFTLNLKPGNHVIECYVKMENGMFHTSMGMAKELWVTDEDSGNKPPEATINMSISSTEGINYEGEITKGFHTFSILYKDQIVHENFVGHDINLVKLEDNANLEELEAWMNWSNPTGLMSPVPEGVTFLGGTNDSPAGSTQYFTANLEPGNYAFIAEVPNTKAKGMFKQFTIK